MGWGCGEKGGLGPGEAVANSTGKDKIRESGGRGGTVAMTEDQREPERPKWEKAGEEARANEREGTK